MSLKQKKMENYKEIGVYNSYEENEFNNRTAKFVGELFKLFVKNKVVIVYKNRKFYITTMHDNGAKYIVIDKGKDTDNICRANITIEFPCPNATTDFYSKLMKLFGTSGIWLEYVDDEKFPYVYINIIKNYENIHYEDIDEGKFEYIRIMTIKEYTGREFEFARLICNTENL